MSEPSPVRSREATRRMNSTSKPGAHANYNGYPLRQPTSRAVGTTVYETEQRRPDADVARSSPDHAARSHTLQPQSASAHTILSPSNQTAMGAANSVGAMSTSPVHAQNLRVMVSASVPYNSMTDSIPHNGSSRFSYSLDSRSPCGTTSILSTTWAPWSSTCGVPSALYPRTVAPTQESNFKEFVDGSGLLLNDLPGHGEHGQDAVQDRDVHGPAHDPTARQNSAVDDNVRTVTCTLCGLVFSGNWAHRNLARHTESKHANVDSMGPAEIVFHCEVCQRPYRRSDALLKHKRQRHQELGLLPPVPRRRPENP